METISSTIRLNYHREQFTYNFNWDIPSAAGRNFLIDYSELSGQDIFRSGKMECTSGPLQGPGKYLEFFLLVKDKPSELNVFVKMSCPQSNPTNEDRENFKFSGITGRILTHGDNKPHCKLKDASQMMSGLNLADLRYVVVDLLNNVTCKSVYILASWYHCKHCSGSQELPRQYIGLFLYSLGSLTVPFMLYTLSNVDSIHQNPLTHNMFLKLRSPGLYFKEAEQATIPIPHSFTNYPEEANSCVKWMMCGDPRYVLSDISLTSLTGLALSLGVYHEKFQYKVPEIPKGRKDPEDEHAFPYATEHCASLKYGQLSTRDLLFCTNWSDVTIYCGDRTFPAHVLILQSKSNVLRAMFSQPMTENLTRELKIEDAEPEIVEEFLRYIYTGTVKDMAKNSVGLFVMAEKYDVQHLKSLCENFILASVSDENVLERYDLGKLLNSNAITSKCVQHMRKNRKTIWKTEEEFFEASQKFPKLFYELFYK